jgi:sugar (pentulose or hexulose) kinase
MTTFTQNDPVILSLDVGTQSVRAVAIDVQGKVRAIGKALMPNYLSLQPGWAEQPVADYWQALHQAAAHLWQVAPNLRSLIVAVTLTTQRGSLVLSDDQGVALRPSILWLDQRKAKHNPTALASPWVWGFKALGVFERIKAFETSIVANWHQQNDPDLWAKVAHYELLSGYLTRQLTDVKQDSVGSQVGYLPFDYKRQKWARAGDWRWSLSPIKPHMLSELVAPGTMIGPINEQSASHLGLKPGTLFVASAADKACEVLGCGAYHLILLV